MVKALFDECVQRYLATYAWCFALRLMSSVSSRLGWSVTARFINYWSSRTSQRQVAFQLQAPTIAAT
ncbi:hypothetical protein Q6245_30155, partial [Klebsiella pneumoniae]|uniref:hypothetical protein n=1 Tax=Klebsiella pneumoniae TaxID=573 RepID=UPI0027321AF0